jgi:hypothetical protein
MVPPFHSSERSRGRGVEAVGGGAPVGRHQWWWLGGSVGAQGFREGKGTGLRRRVVCAMHQCTPRGGEEARRGREVSVVADGQGRKGQLEVGEEADSGPRLSARGREGEGGAGRRIKASVAPWSPTRGPPVVAGVR